LSNPGKPVTKILPWTQGRGTNMVPMPKSRKFFPAKKSQNLQVQSKKIFFTDGNLRPRNRVRRYFRTQKNFFPQPATHFCGVFAHFLAIEMLFSPLFNSTLKRPSCDSDHAKCEGISGNDRREWTESPLYWICTSLCKSNFLLSPAGLEVHSGKPICGTPSWPIVFIFLERVPVGRTTSENQTLVL
jgi:hypothetical protein